MLVLVFSLWFLFSAWRETNRVFADYRNEQKEKQAQAQKSVPAFVRAAHLAINDKQFDDALAHVDVALGYDPEQAEAWLLRGALLIVKKEYSQAGKELAKYLQLPRPQRPGGDQEVRNLLKLCRTAKADDAPSLVAFVDVFQKQKLYPLADQMTHQAEQFISSRKDLCPVYQKRIEATWPGLGSRLSVDQDGKYSLNLGNCVQVRDLSPLRGMPLNSLNLEKCVNVQGDLTQLQGMPLTWLSLRFCGSWVQDLTPLQGMRLTTLSLLQCGQVKDLSPLKGMPLTNLDLYDCNKVSDLRPLQGMPLTSLGLNGCSQIQDLTPLKGMPLSSLSLHGCSGVRDLTPLKGVPLTSLIVQGCGQVHDLTMLQEMNLRAIHLNPKNITKGMDVLRQMKSLKAVAVEWATEMPSEVFWKKYDAGEFNK